MTNTVRNALMLEHTGLVKKVANAFDGGSLAFEDLAQAGQFGLAKAVERYKPGKMRFSSYAYPWIRDAIIHEIAWAGRTIRIPVYAYKSHKHDCQCGPYPIGFDMLDDQPSPLDTMILEEDRSRLYAALDILSPSQRKSRHIEVNRLVAPGE